MNAIHKIIEDAPEQLILNLPPHLRHRKVTVTVSVDNEQVNDPISTAPPKYLKLAIKNPIIPSRDSLYDR